MKRSTRLNRKTRLRAKSELRRRTAMQTGHQPNREWRKVRGWVRDRSGGWCEARIEGVCTGRGDHAHHIQMRSQGGKDELGNLLWTCPSCHNEIHARPAWSYEQGYLRRRHSA